METSVVNALTFKLYKFLASFISTLINFKTIVAIIQQQSYETSI